jgi:rhodanese-related sulfurtransferase
VRIEHVLETHNHADHASGHGRLAAATGAVVHVHALAGAQYPHEPFEDGWELALGQVGVRALHTPGHRPEHTAFALVDTARGPEPWALLSGDSLLVGDVARPDLAVDAVSGARDVFASLRRILALPDACEVWPGHVGGSLCGGAGIDMKVSSTIGYERAHSPLLAIADEDAFVAAAVGSLGAPPPNVDALVAFNRGAFRELAGPHVLRADAVAESDVLVIDVRDDVRFDAGHIPGAVNLRLQGPGFGTRLAQLVGPDEPVVLLGADAQAGARAAGLAAAVGHRAVVGVAGMDEWAGALSVIERLPADRLPARLDDEPGLQLLDVRDLDEFARGHIPGSSHRPWPELVELPAGLDPERPVAVVCRSGRRAATGASLLARAGAVRAIHVADGGVGTWQALGRPVVTG